MFSIAAELKRRAAPAPFIYYLLKKRDYEMIMTFHFVLLKQVVVISLVCFMWPKVSLRRSIRAHLPQRMRKTTLLTCRKMRQPEFSLDSACRV